MGAVLRGGVACVDVLPHREAPMTPLVSRLQDAGVVLAIASRAGSCQRALKLP